MKAKFGNMNNIIIALNGDSKTALSSAGKIISF